MKNSILALAALMLLLFCSCSSQKRALTAPEDMDRTLKAAGLNVDPLPTAQSEKWLKALAKSYTPWTSLSLQGKVKLDMLPLDPSVKIYMERGKLVMLSLRVPLLGEVGRAEIAPDTTLILNRRAGTYTKLPTARMLNRIGVNLTDFQDLLLGRVFLAGSSPLSEETASLFDVSKAAGGNYIVTPRTQRSDAEYGFTLYPDGKMLLAVAFTTDESCLLQTDYTYNKKNTSLNLDITAGKKKYTGILTYEAPDFKAEPQERVKLKSGWKQVTLKELLTEF